jgi:hypothetical protein
MSVELSQPSPLVYANRLTVGHLVNAFLDSPVLRTRIRIGRVNEDGKTVRVAKTDITADSLQASPGERVVIYEVI